MKGISEYVNESGLSDIVKQNLAEISDEEITNEVRDYMGDDLSQIAILNTWNELKRKLTGKTQAWIVDPDRDIDKYNDNCKKWAKQTITRYNITKVKDVEKIMTGIAWVMNGI